MSETYSRKKLLGQLFCRGIPPWYAARVTGELYDHADDLTEAGEDAGKRLGASSTLVDDIVTNYRRRTFCGRHPLLTFLLMPFLVLILVHVVVFHMIAVPLFLCGIDEDRAVQLGAIGFAILPVMLTVWLTGRWSDRAGLTSRVRLVACLRCCCFHSSSFSGRSYRATMVE